MLEQKYIKQIKVRIISHISAQKESGRVHSPTVFQALVQTSIINPQTSLILSV